MAAARNPRRPLAPRRGPATKPLPVKQDARQDKAWRSVAEFRKMLPSIRDFARMLTGDKSVNVIMSNDRNMQAYSSGTDIYLVPPIDLGDDTPHERRICRERLPNGRMACKACDTRDLVLFYLNHEVGHIVGKTFVDPLPHMVKKIEEMVDEWHPPEACNHGQKIKNIMNDGEHEYLGMLGLLNEWLPLIANCLEDARVDANMFRVRPGLRPMFKAGTIRVFEEGIKLQNGDVVRWTEQPIGAQITIGMFLRASGHKIEPEWLDPRVIEVLDDPEIRAICSSTSITRSPHQVVELSLQAYRCLFDIGLCVVPKCEPVPPPPPLPVDTSDNDDEENDEQSGDDQSSTDDGSDGSDDPGDESEDSGSSTDPGNNGKSGDPGTSDDAGQASDDDDTSSTSDSNDGSSNSQGSDQGAEEDRDSEGSNDGSDESGSEDDDDRGDAGSGGGGGTSGRGSDEPESESESGSSGAGDSDSEEQSEGEGPGPDQTGDAEEEDSDSPASGDVLPDEEDVQSEAEDGSEPGSPASGASDPDGGDPEGDTELDDATDPISSGTGEERDPSSQDNPDSGEQGFGSGGDRSEAEESSSEGDSGETGSGSSGGTGSETSASDGSVSDSPAGDPQDGDNEPGGEAPVEPDELGPTGEDVWAEDYEEYHHPEFTQEEMGNPSELLEVIKALTGHDDHDRNGVDAHFIEGSDPELDEYIQRINEAADLRALRSAVSQSASFSTRSDVLHGIQMSEYPNNRIHWPVHYRQDPSLWKIDETLIGKALLRARVTFQANKQAKNLPNTKTGRINPRVLGRRAPVGDDRLFMKRTVPSKRSYFVTIAVDCSGSTTYFERNPRIKRAVMLQAEMLSRLGIEFSIYGCSGGPDMTKTLDILSGDYYVWMMPVKEPQQPWDNNARQRLVDLEPSAENYDGHNIEFMRKILDRRQETDKILIYYTDGAMPAANRDEELQVLSEELATFKRKKYTILAVGINTDSPTQYGLNTVRVESDDDLINVIVQLEKALEE